MYPYFHPNAAAADGCLHPGGVNAALCDGSVRFVPVRFVPDTIDINLWRALSTTQGGA